MVGSTIQTNNTPPGAGVASNAISLKEVPDAQLNTTAAGATDEAQKNDWLAQFQKLLQSPSGKFELTYDKTKGTITNTETGASLSFSSDPKEQVQVQALMKLLGMTDGSKISVVNNKMSEADAKAHPILASVLKGIQDAIITIPKPSSQDGGMTIPKPSSSGELKVPEGSAGDSSSQAAQQKTDGGLCGGFLNFVFKIISMAFPELAPAIKVGSRLLNLGQDNSAGQGNGQITIPPPATTIANNSAIRDAEQAVNYG